MVCWEMFWHALLPKRTCGRELHRARPENRMRLPVETLMAGREAASEATAQQNAARDAAIHRCINQAHRQFPGGEDQDIPRSEAYKACMASAGFQPKGKGELRRYRAESSVGAQAAGPSRAAD